MTRPQLQKTQKATDKKVFKDNNLIKENIHM